jgi:hypothetical protein
MLKKFKTLSIAMGIVLLASSGDAQRTGNGGNFNTLEARQVFEKILMFLDYSVYSESAGIDLESFRNAKEIYDLNSQKYPNIGNRLYVLDSTNRNSEVCVVGSTQTIASLLVETDNDKMVRFFSQNLVRLNKLNAEQKAVVVTELLRGRADSFVGNHCVIQ